jgi:two-component system, NarL family, nitrate/nitrite response regulator NarL
VSTQDLIITARRPGGHLVDAASKGENIVMFPSNSTNGKVDRARVAIADGAQMGTQLLAEALRRSGRFARVLVASRAPDLTGLLTNEPIDLLLISSNFEGDAASGLKLVRELCGLHARIKVVMLLATSERDPVVQAFRAGCRGVFCRAQSVKDLIKCLVCVYRGQIWASSEELTYALEALREPRPLRIVEANASALLTEREMAVVRCVADGLTNKEVGAKLGLSQHTVKNYLFRIFDKLKVSSRVELIYYAMSQSAEASHVA